MIRDKEAQIVSMTPNEFAALLEYSKSLPTGVYPGKCWKRYAEFENPANEPEWWMGTYTELPDKTKCLIEWYRIVIYYPITDYVITGNYPAYNWRGNR